MTKMLWIIIFFEITWTKYFRIQSRFCEKTCSMLWLYNRTSLGYCIFGIKTYFFQTLVFMTFFYQQYDSVAYLCIFILHFVLNVQEQSMLEGHVTNDEKQMNNVQLRQLLRDYKQQKTQFVVMLLPSALISLPTPPSRFVIIPLSNIYDKWGENQTEKSEKKWT